MKLKGRVETNRETANGPERRLSTRLLSLLLATALTTGIGPMPASAIAGGSSSLIPSAQSASTTADAATEPVSAIDESKSIEGDVSVKDSVFAAKVQGVGDGVERALTVGGDVSNVTASQQRIYSLIAYAFDGAKSQASVGGDVTATSATTFAAPEAAQNATGAQDTGTSPAQAGISASNDPKGACAVFSRAETGALSGEIGGGVSAESKGDTTGMQIMGFGSTVTEQVEGNVTATSKSDGAEGYDAIGVDIQAGNTSTVSVEVGGDLAAKAEGASDMTGCGAYLYSDETSRSTLTVNGSITAESAQTGAGAKVSANGSGGASRLAVDGDVTVAGACADLGAGAWLESNDGGAAELVVAGTVHGKTTGLLFDGENDPEAELSATPSFDVTAWKVEVDEGGSLFKKGQYSEAVPEDVGSQVHYIVKVEQPPVGGTIAAVDAQGQPLAKKGEFDVAHAGEKVYLAADLEPGYYLNAAYNGKGERVKLEQDQGGYFVTVPEGGGVYLTADVTQSEEPAAGMSIASGMAQHVFAYSDVHTSGYTNAESELYRFIVYVETDYDTDLDGKCDLVRTYVQVPRAAVEGKYKAPTIFTADPYSAGMRGSNNSFEFDFEGEAVDDEILKSRPAHRAPSDTMSSKDLALDATLTEFSDWNYELDGKTYPSGISSLDYYLVRGFATVQAAGLGTYGSEGVECCGTVMERDAFVDVVEWLHGKEGRRAYADAAGTVEVKATDWSSGHVGMTGLSYPGAMCYEVATSGVDGLDTVVPVAGPSSWYDHSNSQGISTSSNWSYNYTTVLADTCASRLYAPGCDADLLTLYQRLRTYLRNAQVSLQGDYGPYWAARDWYTEAKEAKALKASALIVTGLNDENVSPKHFDLMREAFAASGCEVKSLLHQNRHIVPANEMSGSDIMIKNHTYLEWTNLWFTRALLGVDNEASALADFTVQSNVDGLFYDSDKWNGSDTATMRPGKEGETTVSAEGARSDFDALVSDTFNGTTTKNAACWTLAANSQMTIAGRIPVHVRAKVDDVRAGDIPMSAVLLDVADKSFPAFGVGDIENEVVKEGRGNSLSYDLVRWKQGQTTKKVISTGTVDLRNPEAGYEPTSATTREQPISANAYYDYTVYLKPTYYTVQPGHHLELYVVPFLDYIEYESEEGRDYLLARQGLDPDSIMTLRKDYAFTIDNAGSYATLPLTAAYAPPADPKPVDPKPVNIARAEVSKISAKTYTGKAFTPTPTVTYADKRLVKGRDYTLSYQNNKNAGTAKVVVTGQGSYAGTKTVKFTINKASMKGVSAKKLKARKYTGKQIKPSPKITYKGNTLKKGRDYTLSYQNNKKRGTAKVVVRGKGNFKGTRVLKFKIR